MKHGYALLKPMYQSYEGLTEKAFSRGEPLQAAHYKMAEDIKQCAILVLGFLEKEYAQLAPKIAEASMPQNLAKDPEGFAGLVGESDALNQKVADVIKMITNITQHQLITLAPIDGDSNLHQ